MVRAFYAWDRATAQIRNELGDYYLAQEPPGLAEAIDQFRKVLTIDPNDISASFRLGKVYQWKRDWKAALDQYARVYKADPSYENVAALYNQVAREHADSFSSLASIPGRVAAGAVARGVRGHAPVQHDVGALGLLPDRRDEDPQGRRGREDRPLLLAGARHLRRACRSISSSPTCGSRPGPGSRW